MMEFENLFTANRNEEGVDRAKPFLLREVPAEIAAKQDDLFRRIQEEEQAEEKANRRRPYTGRNLWILIGKFAAYLAAIAGLVIIWTFLPRSEDGVTFAELFAVRPWLFVIGCVLLVAGFVLMVIFARRRPEPAPVSEKARELEKETAALEAESLRALGVPDGARRADLLMKFVKNDRNGNEKEDSVLPHFNRETRLYVENGALCLGYTDVVYAIPLGTVHAICKCKGIINFFGWNKNGEETAAIREAYAPVLSKGMLNFTAKEYCAVVFRSNGRDLGLVAPPYEFDALVSLLPGVPVEEA